MTRRVEPHIFMEGFQDFCLQWTTMEDTKSAFQKRYQLIINLHTFQRKKGNNMKHVVKGLLS